MSANIKSMFYVNEVPWHGLGKKLDKAATMKEALKASGLDFTVEKRKLKFADSGSRYSGEVPDHFATVRTDENKILGVVGSRYEIIQNVDGFAPFEMLVGEGSAIYDTAGALGNGEAVWMLAKLPGNIKIGKDDLVEKYMLFTSRHDGRGHAIVMLTPIRVVCQNTLNLAIAGAVRQFKVKHTANASTKLTHAHEELGLINATFEQAKIVFSELANKKVSVKAAEKFVEKMFPFNKLSKTNPIAARKRSEVLALFDGQGQGSDLQAAKGTAWGLYNAFTEHVDHCWSAKADPSDRLKSIWYETGARAKQAALVAVCESTGVKFGELNLN